MTKRRNYGNFTPKRRAALRRAAIISAKKRHARRKNFTRVGVGVLAVTGVGVGAYLGHKHGDAIGKKVSAHSASIRGAVAPLRKEAIRRAGAIGGNRLTQKASKPKPVVPGRGRPAIVRNVTILPQVDPQSVRDKDTPYREPGFHQRYEEDGSIVQKTDKYLPRELVKGRKIKDTTIQKALNKDAAAKGASGVKAGESPSTTLKGQNEIIEKMVADGTVRKTITGKQISRGVAPEQARANEVKRKRAAGVKRAAKAKPGGISDEQFKDAIGFETSSHVTFLASYGQSLEKTPHKATVVGKGKKANHTILDIHYHSGTERREIPNSRIV